MLNNNKTFLAYVKTLIPDVFYENLVSQTPAQMVFRA